MSVKFRAPPEERESETECRGCGRVNSDAAEICPGCGIRLRKSSATKILIGLAVVFIGLPLICVGGTTLGYLSRENKPSESRARPAPPRAVTQWDEIPARAGALELTWAAQRPTPPPAEQIVEAGYDWQGSPDRVAMARELRSGKAANLNCMSATDYGSCNYQKGVESPVGVGSAATPGCILYPAKRGDGIMITWSGCRLTFAPDHHSEADHLAAAAAIEDWRHEAGRAEAAALEQNRRALREARKPWGR